MTPQPRRTGLDRDALGLVAIFLTSGTTHLVRPKVFEPLIPRMLPAPRALVLGSGVAELACAVGLLVPRTRRLAGYASAALLVGVLPGNLTMSAQAKRRLDARPGDAVRTGLFAASLARLPLQLPMIRTALRAARSAPST